MTYLQSVKFSQHASGQEMVYDRRKKNTRIENVKMVGQDGSNHFYNIGRVRQIDNHSEQIIFMFRIEIIYHYRSDHPDQNDFSVSKISYFILFADRELLKKS